MKTLTADDYRIIVQQHEMVLEERKYSPEIVAELRYYRAKFIPSAIRKEIGHEEPRRPRALDIS